MDSASSGAEAEVRPTAYLGRPAVMKRRLPKRYRHPDLDRSLRSRRTRTEARLIREAREAGARTPIIYDIDLDEGALVMEDIGGVTAKRAIDDGGGIAVCQAIGAAVAAIHRASIAHGDLTTSNMIWRDGAIWLIDFSMGASNATVEELGTDLHLMDEAFRSSHSGDPALFQAVLSSYRQGFDGAEAVIARMRDIESRGRYS